MFVYLFIYLFEDGFLLDKRDEVDALEIGAEDLRDGDAVICLVVLEDAAEGTFSSAEGGVEHVDVLLLVAVVLL